MYAQDCRTVLRRDQGGGNASMHPVRGRLAASDGADRRFARQSGEDRHSQFAKCGQPPQQGQVMRKRLAETEAGVDHQLIAGYSGALKRRDPPGKKGSHLGHYIKVFRTVLHAARVLPHVHGRQNHPRACRLGCCRERARLAKGPDIVEHRDPHRAHPQHHFGLVGIDGQGNAKAGAATQHRHQALHFHLQGHRFGARPRRLGADIEQISPLLHKAGRVRDRGIRVEMAAAVRERIRRHVDHPHQEWPLQRESTAAKRQAS